MATQKAMGRHKLVERLTAQVGNKGEAIAILKKRGDMTASGTLTTSGKKRDSMTAAERAKDRAAKSEGKSSKDFVYNPKTNTARLKGK
jgi:phage I-like protein